MTAIGPMLDAGYATGPASERSAGHMSMLAHDIRGALQGVVGGVAALEASRLPPELVEQIDRISAASRSLQSLIGMAIGVPEAREAALAGEVDLDDFLDYFRDRWAGEAHGLGRELVVSHAPGLARGLRVPHLSLARMVGNLTLNALKHGGRGTVDVSLARAADGGVVIRIADEGPGVPPEVIERLLRGDGGADAEGHGLGLFIVRDLTRRLGCTFTLENRGEGGAAARLVFPAAVCIEDGRGVGATPVAAFPELAGLHVLLAEDNPTNQMVATQMLQALEVEVTIAADGVEALERFEHGSFDLLLVDIEMPRLSGLDVIRRIRARGDARAAVPIIALTAYALCEHRDRIAEAGADGLISKPITGVEALGRGLAAHAGKPREAPSPPRAAVPPLEDAAPVVDSATFEALATAIGDETMAELLDKVIADLQSAGSDLERARPGLDRGAIRSASHILISVAGAIGATRLQSCAQSLNAAAHEATHQRLTGELECCIAEISAAVAFARDRRAAA